MQTSEVLLVTASINIRKDTPVSVFNDPKERLLEYLTSLVAWIKLTSITNIIFCENTNIDYDFSKIIDLAKREGKNLEVLVFSGNRYTHKHGKGYGEGEIIEYAIKNSTYLKNSVNFYKVTGRLFIPEFDKIQGLHSHLSNVFDLTVFSAGMSTETDHPSKTIKQRLRSMVRFLYIYFGRGRGRGPHKPEHHISTLFYKVNVKFYKQNLINSYKRVNDRKAYFLENIFYEDLLKKEFNPFLSSYSVIGRSGSTGLPYSTGWTILCLASRSLTENATDPSYFNQEYSEEIRSIAQTFLYET